MLDKIFWNNCYESNKTGWDIGSPSTPLKKCIDSLQNKKLKILIPGAGNAYEADYLLEKGFRHITIIDIAPFVVQQLKKKYANNEVTIIEGDFFQHQGEYDIILEQTFFCALEPHLRLNYAIKMKSLLVKEGTLTGVLFNRNFEQGPPFGGNKEEYIQLFEPFFLIEKMEICDYSIPARATTELIFSLKNCK